MNKDCLHALVLCTPQSPTSSHSIHATFKRNRDLYNQFGFSCVADGTIDKNPSERYNVLVRGSYNRYVTTNTGLAICSAGDTFATRSAVLRIYTELRRRRRKFECSYKESSAFGSRLSSTILHPRSTCLLVLFVRRLLVSSVARSSYCDPTFAHLGSKQGFQTPLHFE